MKTKMALVAFISFWLAAAAWADITFRTADTRVRSVCFYRSPLDVVTAEVRGHVTRPDGSDGFDCRANLTVTGANRTNVLAIMNGPALTACANGL